MKLVFLSILILGVILIITFGIYFPKEPGSQIEKVFSIREGKRGKEIAENLKDEGLIKNALLFRLYVITIGKSDKLQAGDYIFSPSMTISQIAKKIISGEVIKEKITIIEGWNLRDIGFYFENKGLFMAEELWELVGFPLVDYSKVTDIPRPKDFSTEFDFLADRPKNLGFEGYLFPDTYEIKKGTSLEEIIRKILQNFDKKLTPELREEIKKQQKTIFEIIIIASLIEKEVKTFEDKELVSGILWKRLKNNIPLQVDATISYITGKRTIKISKEETEIDSPYNTYKYLGLSLGPVSNPGLESIIAATSPKDSDFWYYISTPEGKTIFSKTLEDHNLAKAKYLK